LSSATRRPVSITSERRRDLGPASAGLGPWGCAWSWCPLPMAVAVFWFGPDGFACPHPARLVSVLALLVSPSVETPVANRRAHGDGFLYHWLCVIQSVRTWAGWERPHPARLVSALHGVVADKGFAQLWFYLDEFHRGLAAVIEKRGERVLGGPAALLVQDSPTRLFGAARSFGAPEGRSRLRLSYGKSVSCSCISE
jgi:hypothetical protein